jgi:serine/threonine-protein kinase
MSETTERLRTALADRYRLERELGAGGMATVYLAEDLKHGRKVAIKVLHPELSAVIGGERFLTEIRTTASLQHPHILGLIDSGEADKLLYYVMPFVEGETLRSRLERERQLAIGDAVRLAREVAAALEYAHKRGIVHRDIKPENILLQDGQALVADFGIALAMSAAGGSRMTQTGMSLGTPSYMSPEQAMGERDIGPRSDIYALGAMTYEMLVGEPPYTGASAQAIVAKLMSEKPVPPTRLRETVPPGVEEAVLVALQKLPADRWASAREFADALGGEGRTTRITGQYPAAGTRGTPWRGIAAALGAVALALLGVVAWQATRPRTSAGPTVFDAGLPDSARISYVASSSGSAYGAALRALSLAPAGDAVVYVAQQGDSSALWRRDLRTAETAPIPGTAGASSPRISPDGKRVAFFAQGRVMVADVNGGGARPLLDGQALSVLEWTSPTSLVTADLDGYRASWLDPETGQSQNKPMPRCLFGRWIPEQSMFVCRVNGVGVIVDPTGGLSWTIHATAPGGGTGAPVAGSGFKMVGGDLLVYVSPDGDLRAAPYDSATHRIGRPAIVEKGVRAEPLGDAQFDLAPDGTLVYVPGINAEIGQLVRLRAGGTPEPLVADRAAFQRFDLSPDRRWLAVVVQGVDDQELRIYDLATSQSSVWLRGDVVRQPLWSPSGDRLLIRTRTGARAAILAGLPNSGRAPDTLIATDTLDFSRDPVDFADANDVIVQDWQGAVALRLDPTRQPARYDTLLTQARFVAAAPGRRLVAYINTATTGLEVTSYPVPGRRWQVAENAVEPQWLSPTELLYRSGRAWYVVRVDPATGERAAAPAPWASDPRFSDTSGWSNRMGHDGSIIYVQSPPQVQGPYLRVVPGWVTRARAAAAAANR